MRMQGGKIESVLRQAAKLVSPTRQEEENLRKVSEHIKSLLDGAFEKAPAKTRPEITLGGSYAKGTWLRDEADIDYFLRYPVDYPREKLESEAIEIASGAVKRFDVNLRYAEHPYVEAFVGKARINLVPCYMVEKGKWQSAADRSPFHAEYVRSKIDPRLRLEVRLLKKFAKVARVYGAEVRTRGFSGYVCEVLVLKYGSFESALSAISDIQKREVISIEPFDKELASSFESALVILDPIDTTRNLGAAISGENVAKLVLNCRAFLSRPARRYFDSTGSERAVPVQKDLAERTLVLTFRNTSRSPDILWGQLSKSVLSISRKLELIGFEVLRSLPLSNEAGKSAFVFLLRETMIPRFQTRRGPEVFRRKDSEEFISKNRGRFLLSWLDEEGRIISVAERSARSIDAYLALKGLLSDSKKGGSIGLSKTIRDEIGRGFALRRGSEVLREKSELNSWLRSGVASITRSEAGL